MKKYLLALFIVAGSLGLKAQWVTIPDTAFVNYLNANGLSSCINGNLLDTTCPVLISSHGAYIGYTNIVNLEGLQYFDSATNNVIEYNPYLTTIPNLTNCSLLSQLVCQYNPLLTHLPPIPLSIWILRCAHNSLSSVSNLPYGNLMVDFSYNQLSALPNFPCCQQNSLDCSHNLFSNLSFLPNSLHSLDCSYNPISNLPNLPPGLTGLSCNNNALLSLPLLPNTLVNLVCYSNFLSSLPALPNTLKILRCGQNNISSIPSLPDSVTILNCDSNLNLFCLPELKKIASLSFVGTSVDCIPNYLNVVNSNPPFNTLSLCEVLNSHGCPIYYNITGRVFFDENNNCIDDSIDSGISGIKVFLLKNGTIVQQTYTVFDGTYSFNTDSLGTYGISIDTLNLPFVVSCPSSGIDTANVIQLSSVSNGLDFALLCKANIAFDVGVNSITAGVHGIELLHGTNNTIRIHLYNTQTFYPVSCDSSISGAVTLIINGHLSYTSPANGSQSPNTINGNVITWNISNFAPFNANQPLDILVRVDSTAQLGDVGCFTVIVTHPVGDYNIANDTLTVCFPIGLPYDPNDKAAYPAGDIDTAQNFLTYTIRFQNTGTAEAQHIHIDDTLDTDLDESTFQLLTYSHQPLVQIKENIVRFDFPNINLPDSNTNEPTSHGYVQYRIKTKPNLNCGTTMGNPAYIYFDFNAPVVTNTPVNTIHHTTTTNLQASVCNGENYDFHGTQLNVAGIYTDTLHTATVCDSLVQLTLSILSVYSNQLDTAIEQGNTYTLPSGNTVSVAGIYIDTLQTIEGCDSVVTTNLSIVSNVPVIRNPNSAIRIYPNPASDQLNIEIDETLIDAQLNIYDVTGSLIQTGKLEIRNSQFEIRNLPSGVYTAEVKTNEASVKCRWVKM